MMDRIQRAKMEAVRHIQGELEEIVSGLMINGVRNDEIEIQNHLDRYVVCVRGEPKYEVKLKTQ